MILVVGATSKPGQNLIPMLVEKGYRVRAMTRTLQKLDYARSLGVEVVDGDIRQPDTHLRACEGAEVVVSSVTAILGVGQNNIHTVDKQGHFSLIEIAKRSGVKRFIFISIYDAASNHPVDFFRIKYSVEEYLKASNMDYTILRPTAFMESWCARIKMQVLNDQPVTLFGDGENPINFISAIDIAKFMMLALEDSRLRNEVLTIGGPQNLTLNEVVALYEKLFRKQANKIYTRAWQLKLQSMFYKLFDENKSRFMAMRYELATSNWQVDMKDVMRQFPILLTRLEDIKV